MKRQSIAEITLTKQIKGIDVLLSDLQKEHDNLITQLNVYRNIKHGLTFEIDRLRKAREEASDRVHAKLVKDV